MKLQLFFIAPLAAISISAVTAADAAENPQGNWPQWRGPLANGVAPKADPPLEWSETKNVKWKVAIPGEGSSTPAIWNDRIFVLTAVPTGKKTEAASTAVTREENPPGEGRRRRGGGFGRSETPTEFYQFTVLCLDRKTGKTIWKKVAREEVPHENRQQNNTFASASPITDGKVVLAFFGSRGLHCYDLDGNLKWSKEFGKMQTRMGFGEGASPALHGNTVVVTWDDEQSNDMIVALNKDDGKEIWRTPRDEPTGWSTPLILDENGKSQVVVNATRKVRSYDLATGQEIWSCGGQTANAIPTPVADEDTIYVTSGFRGAALFAIKRNAKGDIEGTDAIRWKLDANTPYVPSPLLVDDLIYLVKGNAAMLSCYDAKSGKPHYEAERLEGISEIYASPVAARDRVYILGRDGSCLVLKKSPKLEILARNKLDDHTDASIAMVDKELFIRGAKNLYCIAAE